jgi:putative membrane protein
MMPLPQPLHFGGLVPEGWLHSDWQFEPTVLLLVFGVLTGYFWLTGPYARKHDLPRPTDGQKVAFLIGTFTMLIALGPPLDDWANYYLLSAHMLQHLLLMVVTAPLWLMALPGWFFRPINRRRKLSAVGRFITSPVPAIAIGSAIMVVWHLPVLYDRALMIEPLHVLQHQSFLYASILMWWPIIGPNPAWPRVAPLGRMLILFASTLPGGFVGAFITLAEPGMYSHYVDVPRLWGIDLAMDQELAGLMMWVGVPAVYLSIISGIFFRWVASEERKDEDERAARQAAAKPPVN